MSSILAFLALEFCLFLCDGEEIEHQRGVSIWNNERGVFNNSRADADYGQELISYEDLKKAPAEGLKKGPAEELKTCQISFFIRSEKVCEFVGMIGGCRKFAEVPMNSTSISSNKNFVANYTFGFECFYEKLRSFLILFCLLYYRARYSGVFDFWIMSMFIQYSGLLDEEIVERTAKFRTCCFITGSSFSIHISRKFPIVGFLMSLFVFVWATSCIFICEL